MSEKRPTRLSIIERVRRRGFLRPWLLDQEPIQKCTCIRTFSGKNQYTNPVGCPIHWKEPTI